MTMVLGSSTRVLKQPHDKLELCDLLSGPRSCALFQDESTSHQMQELSLAATLVGRSARRTLRFSVNTFSIEEKIGKASKAFKYIAAADILPNSCHKFRSAIARRTPTTATESPAVAEIKGI